MKKLNLLLAPMDAITHEAFRNLVGRFGGCDEYFNEMINASSLLNNGPWEKYYLLEGPEPEKLVWQLTDKSAEKMAGAVRVLAERNGKGIDLNMGCSAPQIAKTGAGIAWMLKPIEETALMVRSVKSEIENAAKDGAKPKRLSVKLRLGDEKYTEERFFDFCKMLIDEGVDMITLHARRQKQKHSRHSDWSAVARLCERFSGFPVVLNGDVKDFESLSLALKTAPKVSGVMIATAAVQKPWIFRELKDFFEADENSEKLKSSEKNEISENAGNFEFDAEKLALDFIDEVEKCQPPEFWKTRLQRFFAFYCLNFSFGHYFQSQMINISGNDDARERIRMYFEKCPEDRILSLKSVK
ncbi:MAG: tRNA-dihydrouridine synthase family protein [Treponema sp.]|nr:tRNA-dihydrouridine synthase family protein [Treponema sp.]